MKRNIQTAFTAFFIILFTNSFCQTTRFEKGYGDGLKYGFCYNVKDVFCSYPVTFLFPQPRMNESAESYQDGYNRGFQTGLDFQRIDNNNFNNDYYNNLSKKMPAYKSNQYISPVDLELMQSVNEQKQKLFYSRAEWVQERVNRLYDLSSSVLSTIAPMQQSRIDNSLTDYIKQLSSGVDFSDYSVFNQIVAVFNDIEINIKRAYSNAISNMGTGIVPTPDNTESAYINCSFVAYNSKIVSYNITVRGKKSMPADFTTFSIRTEQIINEIPAETVYYVYSKLGNCYYYTADRIVASPSFNNVAQPMKFAVSGKCFFMKSNSNSFWLFDEGVSVSSNLQDFGERVYKTTDGTIEAFRIYKNKTTGRAYYIPSRIYNHATINDENPVYSN